MNEIKVISELTLEEFLSECEAVGVGFELNETGKIEFYGGMPRNIKRLTGLLKMNAGLKNAVMKLAESERLNKNLNNFEPLIPCFDYPSMKHCFVADSESRHAYKEMCEHQYGTLNRYVVPFHEKLFQAGLIRKFDDTRYVLTWPEYERL